MARDVNEFPDAKTSAEGRTYSRPPAAEQLRELLRRADLSQRGAARELDVAERTMRYWCSGEQPVPRMAILALERLIDMNHSVQEAHANQSLIDSRLDEAIDKYRRDHGGTSPTIIRLGISERQALQRFAFAYGPPQSIGATPNYRDIDVEEVDLPSHLSVHVAPDHSSGSP